MPANRDRKIVGNESAWNVVSISSSFQSVLFSDRSVTGLAGGISTETFQNFVNQLLVNWRIIDVYQSRAAESIEFQYTHWPDPDNRTARGQEFINVRLICF